MYVSGALQFYPKSFILSWTFILIIYWDFSITIIKCGHLNIKSVLSETEQTDQLLSNLNLDHLTETYSTTPLCFKIPRL